MKTKNIGIVKATIFNKVLEEYLTEGEGDQGRSLTKKFISIVKDSPVLQEQLSVYKNLETKTIKNDEVATRFIDECITTFSKYNIDQVHAANKLLEEFDVPVSILVEMDKVKLYEAIDQLILQNTQGARVNVDRLHSSFETVLNHVKSNKIEVMNESAELEIPALFTEQQIVDIALDKFNERYSDLDSDEREILRVAIGGDYNEKNQMFENLKQENLEILESIDDSNLESKITETSKKIKDMKYENDHMLVENLISLHELKKNLLS
jgi:hypothetical protein